MPDLLSIAVLTSFVLLPVILRRAGRTYETLFETPKTAGMRRFYIGAMIVQAVCAVIWLVTDASILGIPIHIWAAWALLFYFWIRTSQLVRNSSIAPPASPLQ